MRVSVACTWSDVDGYISWDEAQSPDIVSYLESADTIVGFNVNNFDYRVLSAYSDVSRLEEKTFDILDEIRRQGVPLTNLGRLAFFNLGETKTFGGVDAIRLWREGLIQELKQKCQRDVELTQRLFETWDTEGVLWVSETRYAIWPGLVR
jgi:hypothetical protein